MSNWTLIDNMGSVKMFYETETETFEARVIQGGNGLWTAYVYKTTKGRKKKKGTGCIAGKVILAEVMKPQAGTKELARIWAEEIWTRIAP